MFKICVFTSLLWLLPGFVFADDEMAPFVPPLSEEGVDPYSEDLYLYLRDANENYITISVEEGGLLLINEQEPTKAQLATLKLALADLQQQGPITPQASQAIDYIINLISKVD
ncbi:hypothetical protein [Motilimonas sp. KMU-193]|uniref:hypothetical protein n=1 Tax=Motilimonas sp. KMU-193 TaxID=3388668 RepID=UPI00396AFE94